MQLPPLPGVYMHECGCLSHDLGTARLLALRHHLKGSGRVAVVGNYAVGGGSGFFEILAAGSHLGVVGADLVAFDLPAADHDPAPSVEARRSVLLEDAGPRTV